MMTEIEIEIIRLALDTEIEHKDYAKHNLAAKKVLNANEAENKGQSLPIDNVIVPLVCDCEHGHHQTDKNGREYCRNCDKDWNEAN